MWTNLTCNKPAFCHRQIAPTFGSRIKEAYRASYLIGFEANWGRWRLTSGNYLKLAKHLQNDAIEYIEWMYKNRWKHTCLVRLMYVKQMGTSSPTVDRIKRNAFIAIGCSTFAIAVWIGLVVQLYETMNELQLQVLNDVAQFRVCFILSLKKFESIFR